jgi:hypothetical protein
MNAIMHRDLLIFRRKKGVDVSKEKNDTVVEGGRSKSSSPMPSSPRMNDYNGLNDFNLPKQFNCVLIHNFHRFYI